MQKDFYDIAIVVPLEEELAEVLHVFTVIRDLHTKTQSRFEAAAGTSQYRIIVSLQEGMGKGKAAEAASGILAEYEVGLIVCVGIAGALSGDLRLGDVCYTGTVIDVIDNARAQDNSEQSIEIDFSPTQFETPRELTAPLNFNRTLPSTNELYVGWQSSREGVAKALVPEEIPDRDGKPHLIGRPATKDGAIVCGWVSKSTKYNKRLLLLHRKLLAIETESGGIFEEARRRGIPAITIRGISDHANAEKSALESSTGGRVRKLAAGNAASFLKLQLDNPDFTWQLDRHRIQRGEVPPDAANSLVHAFDLISLISRIGEEVDENLRELSPQFRLKPKGYQLPVPRLRRVNDTASMTEERSTPLELTEALNTDHKILLMIPRTYPDNALPWVLADALLTAEAGGKQTVPIVLDCKSVKPPTTGLDDVVSQNGRAALAMRHEVQIVFILENIPVQSPTRLTFLLKQVELFPDASFIFLDRSDGKVIHEFKFKVRSAAVEYSLCNISFFTLSHFIQKNFDMTGMEAEVIAIRLREIFQRYRLDAHPTYFAGVPRETLSALIQASRRAELLQIAVDGFLTIVVAEDKSDVALSRTTRTRFLRKLAVMLRVEKQNVTQADIILFTKAFAEKYDFEIDSWQFINAFLDKGILYFDGNYVRFALPFIESYLLAKELSENDDLALKYFIAPSLDIDFNAFDLYSEIGACAALVKKVLEHLDQSIKGLVSEADIDAKEILLSSSIHPNFLNKKGRTTAFEARVKQISADIQNEKDDSGRKQQILDMSDRIKETLARKSEQVERSSEQSTEDKTPRLEITEGTLELGIVLLGSGAEHLDGETKRELATRIVTLSSRIIDKWTRLFLKIDFKALKTELTDGPGLQLFKSKNKAGMPENEAKELAGDLIDLFEFAWLSLPLGLVLSQLCEQARRRVLAGSIRNVTFGSITERLIKAIWLIDIEGIATNLTFKAAVRELPAAVFLRTALATHLITRVYWHHSDKENRLYLLDAADQILKATKSKAQREQGESVKEIVQRTLKSHWRMDLEETDD